MTNLMKTNLYRLVRQPSTWVILALTALNTAIAGFSTGVLFGNAPWVATYYESASSMLQENNIDILGVLKAASVRVSDVFEYTSFAMFAANGLFLSPPILMIFFVMAFIVREKTFGFVKNLIPQFSRNQIETGHILMLLVYSLGTTLVSAATGSLLYRAFFTSYSTESGAAKFLLFLLVEALLVFVLGLFVLVLSDLFRRPFTGAIVSIVYFTLGVSLVYSVLNSIVGGRVPVQAVLPYGCLSTLLYSDGTSLGRAGIVALLYAVLFILLRFYIVKNKALKDKI